MLQNPRSKAIMLANPICFFMTPEELIVGVFILVMVVFVVVIMVVIMVFECVLWRVSILNQSTFIGIAVAGSCICTLGFVLGQCDRITGIDVCLLGGCFGVGTYCGLAMIDIIIQENKPRDQQNRESEKPTMVLVFLYWIAKSIRAKRKKYY